MRRPKVKICGVTTVEDALLAAALGADYLGLNFYPPSPRALDLDGAVEIARAVRAVERPPALVGVFVDRPRAEIEAIDERVGLDLLQFHGDEPPPALRPFAGRAIKVLRVSRRLDAQAILAYRDAARLWGFLIDYHHPTLRGGSGVSWDFASAGDLVVGKPLFIAGGLTPANVGAAIAAARPWGIDVCSGVEVSPGRKDAALLRRLFREIDHVTCSAAS
ncbi:MAG: phosphoribosylanthranilate isomerase [Acidobacteria bacterium]|nr:MAG: phosphoribosylanthranilate isomerase [Acidobacteriota bacterium]